MQDRRNGAAGGNPAGRFRTWLLAIFAGSFGLLIPLPSPSPVPAQVLGDEAEMERLQSKAEEAIANGDADGAAMNSGKAALMASQLASRRSDQATSQLYRGAESLFRAQEHAYRALALFQRAGGQPPASSGVCSTMKLAGSAVEKSVVLLGGAASSTASPGYLQQIRRLQAIAADWDKTIEGMNDDFQCR